VLRQNLTHDAAVDVGEAVIAASVAPGEALVVEAQEVQHRGVQAVWWTAGDGRTELIGFAMVKLATPPPAKSAKLSG
jgi:hypothetical protein